MNTASSRRIFRSRQHSSIGGVCAGIALAKGYSVSLTRMAALLIMSFAGIGILVYLLLWILMPLNSENSEEALANDPLKRSSEEGMLGGVCAGIAKFLEVDTALTRVLVVLFVIAGGAGIIPYIYAWAIVPKE